MQHEPPVRVTKAAAELGLSIHTIRAWVAQRRIAYVRLGRSIRIPASEIRRLLEAGFVPAAGGHTSRLAQLESGEREAVAAREAVPSDTTVPS